MYKAHGRVAAATATLITHIGPHLRTGMRGGELEAAASELRSELSSLEAERAKVGGLKDSAAKLRIPNYQHAACWLCCQLAVMSAHCLTAREQQNRGVVVLCLGVCPSALMHAWASHPMASGS